ncbi:maleylpyruvate isomerase N-terminal domain-containing protein [Cellulomonas sp. ATA003]|uniref:maleylpyruvate isomerase N-terminal domain-containing protein n=1 Tax=Cellulomonas sp. ATA003 TaxID=3073064 RepID=UPI002872E3A8|nr:maleylpyruvate isomerase N-terminal domain-containing protein [Cellulomonas sp. ATA003]WNB85313.1 maleylpyruvate isomerase N-terminal domain-containing protein [Cellulomonas sp. ATA003]
MPADPAGLLRATTALHDQWAALRPWVRDLLDDVPDTAARPSVLAGWSVADLVAHLGRAMDALTAVTPAPPTTTPLPLRAYLAGYAAGAATIAEVTRSLAADIADDPLTHVDRMVEAALEHLAALGPHDRVVVARRGPITLTDMVVSRVLELVVHADDLARSLPERGPAALDPGAVHVAARSLVEVLQRAGGPPVRRLHDPMGWVRLAAGRGPLAGEGLDDAVAAAVETSSGTAADVARHLPLL